jgi:hypothetical protein
MRKLAACVALASVALGPSTSRASDEPLGLTLSADAVNRYVSRGYNLSHSDAASLVYLYYSPRIAPGVTVSTGFIFGLANNPRRGDRSRQIDEVDLNFSYERPVFSWLSANAGYHYYAYTSRFTRKVSFQDDYDTETSLAFQMAAPAGISSSVTWYHGLDRKVRGNYFELGLQRNFAWTEALSSAPRVVAGWSNQYSVDHEWTNVTTTLPLTWTMGRWSVSPSLTYVRLMHPKPLNGNNDKNQFVGGLNLTLSF